MTSNFLLGTLFALLFALVNSVGSLLQKSAVNRIHARLNTLPAGDGGSFTARFLRDPVWWAGLILNYGIATIFNLSAQVRIGPTLFPALAATGMIFLALLSTRFLHEKLRLPEWLGIFCIVAGVSLLGFSSLDISLDTVNIYAAAIQMRYMYFTAAVLLIWVLSWLLAAKIKKPLGGLLLALSSGLPFTLSNLWILPMLVTIGRFFSFHAKWEETTIFLVSCFILIISNVFGVRQTQEAFRSTPASKALPLQQVFVQIVPIFIYLIIFQHSFTPLAVFTVPVGVALIITGGFLLGNNLAVD